MNEVKLNEKVNNLMKMLNLEKSIWKDIDPYLFIMAFTHPSGSSTIPIKVRNYQEKYYGSINLEFFELHGDRVLEMIVSTLLMEMKQIESVGDLVYIKTEIIRNSTLFCYMDKKGLCKEIITGKKTDIYSKVCSDSFEAILGVLFYHGYYILGKKYSILDDMKTWLINNWNINETVYDLIETGESSCVSSKKFSTKKKK